MSEQAIETLRLLRDAFGVIFRVTEDKIELPLMPTTGNGAGFDEDDDEVLDGDFEDLEEKPQNDDRMEEDDEDEEDEEDDDSEDDGSEDDSQGNAMEEDDEHSSSRGQSEQDDSDDDSDAESDGDISAQKEKSTVKFRETFLLSCLGTGYVNTNRKVT